MISSPTLITSCNLACADLALCAHYKGVIFRIGDSYIILVVCIIQHASLPVVKVHDKVYYNVALKGHKMPRLQIQIHVVTMQKVRI